MWQCTYSSTVCSTAAKGWHLSVSSRCLLRFWVILLVRYQARMHHWMMYMQDEIYLIICHILVLKELRHSLYQIQELYSCTSCYNLCMYVLYDLVWQHLLESSSVVVACFTCFFLCVRQLQLWSHDDAQIMLKNAGAFLAAVRDLYWQ